MDDPTIRRPDGTEQSSAPKATGASESKIAGLSTLPEKRPARRMFGLFRGKRGQGAAD